MKKTVLRAYARLIAEVGARVQKGQDVVIEAELDQPEFVTMVADACYHAGARKVTVTWKHQALEKLAIRRESVKTLQTVEAWERAKLQHYVDTLPCRIYLLSEDPDGLRGDEIPISAQVVSLADVYDALISKRVYKEAFSHEKAMQMILDGECGTFNGVGNCKRK